MKNIATRRLCPPARLPSPGEQLLWRSAMSTRDLRDDRVRSQRLFDRQRLLPFGPPAPTTSSSDHLDAPKPGAVRLKRRIKSRHKPYLQIRRSDSPLSSRV